MKTALGLLVATVALQTSGTAAWWDNGHMLSGEIASQLMAKQDAESLHSVLNKWDTEFPNTKTIATAAVWPDLIKCSSVSPYCMSPASPSLNVMGDWHYIDLPLHVNGSQWKDRPLSLAIVADAIDGNLIKVLESLMTTFPTTKSVWAANFALRNLIHFIGDLHMPLHTVAGISAAMPGGDAGGNSYKFASPCAFANLHAMWDAGAGLYSANNWAPNMDSFKDALKANATVLKSWVSTTTPTPPKKGTAAPIPNVTDSVPLDAYTNLTFKEFASKVVSDGVFRKMALESYQVAQTSVYPGLNLTIVNKTIACPSAEYTAQAQLASQKRLALAGKRIAIFLAQIAKQLRDAGIAK